MAIAEWKMAQIEVRPRLVKAAQPGIAYVLDDRNMNQAKNKIETAKYNLERQMERNAPDTNRPINKQTVVALAMKELDIKLQGLLDDYRELRRRYYKELLSPQPNMSTTDQLAKGIYMIEDYIEDAYYGEYNEPIKKVYKIAFDAMSKIDDQEYQKASRK